MKYCSKCGAELFDDAVVCVKCGCPVGENPILQLQRRPVGQTSGLVTATKILMIIGTVFMAIYTLCIGLAWCIPMTISYNNKIKRGEQISTGFKVCTLLFVNMIAGILMLCDERN